MATTLIRQAGPYTVTTDGSRIYINGEHAVPLFPPAGSPLKWVLDTGRVGANGKRDVVGLTAEQWAIHEAARAAREAEMLAAPKSLHQQRADLVEAWAAVREEDAQARHDAIETMRVTGRGESPPDRAAEIAVLWNEIDRFDTEHPEIKRSITDARALRNAWKN